MSDGAFTSTENFQVCQRIELVHALLIVDAIQSVTPLGLKGGDPELQNIDKHGMGKFIKY